MNRKITVRLYMRLRAKINEDLYVQIYKEK